MSSDPSRGPPRQRPVTSVDVARAAGVSQTTVSLVVSGRADGRISVTTQERVRAVAAELGYVPNSSARVLRGGSPGMIALAVPYVRNPYFANLLVAIERAARAEGMAVVLIDNGSDSGWRTRLIAMERAQLLAGAIVYDEGSPEFTDLIKSVDNLVFVERHAGEAVANVDLDMAGGMRQVVDHLHALGHTRVGHARADFDRYTFALRATHLRASLKARGLPFSDAWAYRSSFERDKATAAALEFLRGTDVTAVFCDDDIVAAYLYRACRLLDLRVPQDLSIIGFNDTDLARQVEPELTSVAIPADEVGQRAVESLFATMNGAAPRATVVPLQLRERGSTATPRRHTACIPRR